MNSAADRFTDVYLKFTRLFTQVRVCETEPQVRVPEKVIRCIWNDQLFKTPKLHTTHNEELEIVFPGYWNFGPGPDFKSAAIRVNGRLYEGDVELHVFSSDWKAHDHSSNPEYDGVILHTFLWKRGSSKATDPGTSGRSRKKTGSPIFELELKDFLTRGILELNDELDFEKYPILNSFNHGLCHKPLARLSREQLVHLLNAAGDARVYTKMDRYHDRVILQGYEQTLYEGLAEALGYPSNKQPFRNLAEMLPLDLLKQLTPKSVGERDRILHVQALLFGMAGMIDFKGLEISSLAEPHRTYFKKIQSLWKKYQSRVPERRVPAEDWKFGGIRPANYPWRRIAALAHLVVRHWKSGLFADYMKAFQEVVSQKGTKGYSVRALKPMYNFFCVETKDYWADHYAPGGKTLSRPQRLIGPGRSREIIVNIIIPLGLIYARASKSIPLETGFNMLFQSGKSTGDNKLIRFMKHYIFGNREDMVQVLKTDKQVQGLMQVYQDFCTQNGNNCLRCQFPDVVDRYFR